MRIAFILLLLANLSFMAWATWVDTPQQRQTNDSTARLPRLKLVGEVTPPPRAQAGTDQSAHKVTTTSPTAAMASSSGVAADAAIPSAQPSAEAPRCVSVGPFNDLTNAARAASALHSRGFTPQQRAEEGEVWEGFWVYIGGVDDVDTADRILKALNRGGFNDAHLMPDTGEGRRISVGLFSERERAERRAKAVQKLGLKTEVAERTQAGTVYWVDLSLKSSDGSVPIQDLLANTGAAPSSRLSVQSCPTTPGAQPAGTPDVGPSEPAPAGAHVPSTTVAGTPQLKDAR